MNFDLEIKNKLARLTTCFLLIVLGLNSNAQNFKILYGVPHLPSFVNSSSVSSPETGMMIYNQTTSQPEIYTGSGWSDLFNAKLEGTTALDYFSTKNGIPIMPAYATAKSSDSEIVSIGATFYNTTDNEIKMWNGESWLNLSSLSTNDDILSGSLFHTNSTVDAFFIPFYVTVPMCEQGALLFYTTTKKLSYYDGVSWLSINYNSTPIASSVSQTGIINVGATLNGSYLYDDADSDIEGTSTFKWYRSDSSNGSSPTVISGQTSQTYTLTTDDLGKYIGFSVTPVATTGTSPGIETITVTFSGPIGSNEPPVASNVTQSGDAAVGEVLTGSYTYSDNENDTEGLSLFTWYRSDDASGTNEIMYLEKSNDALTYTLTESAEGYYFRFGVTPVASTGSSPGTEVKVSSYIGPVVSSNAAPEAQNVYITGVLAEGQTLTGNYSFYDQDGDSESGSTYKWYRSSSSDGSSMVAISGATSQSYTLVSADNGQYIGFSVTPAAATGTSPGDEVISTFQGQIGAPWTCGDSFAITHTQGEIAPESVTITYETKQYGLYCWLKQSLGETSVATNVDNTPTSWYFQFNRKQGWKLSDPTNSDWFGESIDEELNWVQANDPCTLLLGSTWRVPTVAEWSSAASTGQDFPLWSSIFVTNYTQQLIFSSQTSAATTTSFWSNTQLFGTYGYSLTSTGPGYSSFAEKSNALPIRCVK